MFDFVIQKEVPPARKCFPICWRLLIKGKKIMFTLKYSDIWFYFLW